MILHAINLSISDGAHRKKVLKYHDECGVKSLQWMYSKDIALQILSQFPIKTEWKGKFRVLFQ